MAGENRYIEYKYTLEPDKYMVDFDVTFKSMEGYNSFKSEQPYPRLENVHSSAGKGKAE